MDINDIAAKGAHAIACRYGKKVLKQGTAPAIPESKTITLTGDSASLARTSIPRNSAKRLIT